MRQRNPLSRITLLMTLAAAALLAGCAAINDRPDPAPVTFEAGQTPAYFLGEERLAKFANATSEDARKSVRNHYIVTSVISVTENYDAYKQALQTQDLTGDIGLELLTFTLSGAGTLIQASGALRVLHAIVGGTTAAKSSVDKHALFDEAVRTLTSQMDARRTEVEARLLEGMQRDTTQYSMLNAYRDLRALYHAGTLRGALATITHVAEIRAQEAEADIERLAFNLDQPATQLRDLLCDDNECTKLKPDAVDKLRACQESTGTDKIFMLDLVLKPEFAKERAEALACML